MTADYLRMKLPGIEVISPDIPLDPKLALRELNKLCHDVNPDVIIGTSMGAMYAQQMHGFCKILVNPAFHVSQIMRQNMGINKFTNPRKDGETEFKITGCLCDDYEIMEMYQFYGITAYDKAHTYAFFGTEDTLVNGYEEYLKYYSNATQYPGGHSLLQKWVKAYVLPCIQKLLEEEPDMIIADFVQMNDNEIAFLNKKPIQQANEFTTIDIQGHELLEENYCRYYWRTMYKKRFLIDNNISFIPGIYAQDIPFTNECFLKVEKCLKTTWLLNIYRRGHSSASSLYSLRRANDTSIALGKVWNFINTNLPPLTKQKQEELVFHLFLSHIYAIPFGHLKGLPEIIKAYDFMKSELPILSFKHNLRQRIWTFLFYKVPTPIFSLFIYLKVSILKKSNQSPTLSHVSD